MQKQPTTLAAMCPTFQPEALQAEFGIVANFGLLDNVPLKASFAEIPCANEDSKTWVTRTAPIDTYHHRAAEVLELAAEPQMGFIDGAPVPLDSDDGYAFWPIVSNEFMAKAFCGELGAARELMRAIEYLWSTDANLTAQLIEERDENPLQVYLFEFEPEGYGIVHVSFNYDWDDSLMAMEEALRAMVPDVFKKLPYVFDSNDYFGTYDFYCSKNFTDSTNQEMAEAAWSHCIRKDSLREFFCNDQQDCKRIDALVASVEAKQNV